MLALFLSAVLACVISFLVPIRAKSQFFDGNDSTPRRDSIQHVLLLSIDGMHGLDLANLVKDRPESVLAKLSRHAVTYSNASTSFPSNSWPGLLSMVSGGSPNVTGVIFENSYDRSLSPPASGSCSTTTGVLAYPDSATSILVVRGGGCTGPRSPAIPPTRG